MAIFKRVVLPKNRVIPKNVDVFVLSKITDALWYGVVNIETAALKVSTGIADNQDIKINVTDLVIPTGDGDGDYPVFALDEENWIDDPDPLRPAWGVCIPFYRSFVGIAEKTLLTEIEDKETLMSYTLGYFPNQQEQLNAGKIVTCIGEIKVTDKLFFSEATAYRGAGHAIVDIPLRAGNYSVYVIEDSVRDKSLDEYLGDAYPDEELNDADNYDVIRSLLIVHNSKVGFINKKLYPMNNAKLEEIKSRLESKDVVGKAVDGPSSYNAVGISFWISVWTTRESHAFSWNLQGLTFPKEHRKKFIELYKDSNGEGATKEQIDWSIYIRGLRKEDINFPK